MACPHLTAAFGSLAAPRPSQPVHKEECTLCFDDQDGPNGVDVCLNCFNGACTGNGDRQHSKLHLEKTSHPLVVNVKRRTKSKPKDNDGSDPPPPKKLAIVAESDADKYDYTTTPRCLACDPSGDGKELPRTEKLEEVIAGIMGAMSSAQQSEVKAWEEEFVACQHTQDLVQPGASRKLELSALASCSQCEMTSNLWLCLTCGNLGCGRAQFGGVGGNSHGLSHFEQSGHPVSVKQGTVTAEGTADIYCYACNDARLDPSLAQHLSHFGINVMDLSKTEKSMTELQLEQNLKFDFNMTGEDGKQLEPVYGPGHTGLRNLGNSCYLASVLQSVFALPAFQSRYRDAYRPHTLSCTLDPASCFECQMGKIADGLLSGRYAVPRTVHEGGGNSGSLSGLADVSIKDSAKVAGQAEPGPIFQAGIRPNMFKSLIGKGHEEFSTMRQQDADEFFKHLVSFIQRDNRRIASASSTAAAAPQQAPTNDPTAIFSFGLEQRLQCQKCHKVRYTVEAQDAGLSLPVPIRPKVQQSADSTSKQPAEGVRAPKPEASNASKVNYEPVQLSECLDAFTAVEELEYHCPSCDEKVTATKRTLFTTFPEVLAVQVRRFQLINWVPTKVNVPIVVPLEPFELDKYIGRGKQDGEELLPEDAAPEQKGALEPEFDVGAMSQLTAMGFPEIRSKKALLATGNSDAEVAMNWLFAHMEDADIDDPIDFSHASTGSASGGSASAVERAGSGADTSMLEEMGFTKAQSLKALRLSGNNAEVAAAWLFENADDPGDDPSVHVDAPMEGEPSGATTGSRPVVGGRADLPARYALKTFISHKGPSVHSGHYVSHVKSGDEWVFFNDEKVVRAPLTATSQKGDEDDTEKQDIGVTGLSKLAYEYFFERA